MFCFFSLEAAAKESESSPSLERRRRTKLDIISLTARFPSFCRTETGCYGLTVILIADDGLRIPEFGVEFDTQNRNLLGDGLLDGMMSD